MDSKGKTKMRESGGLRALPMIGLALAIGILSLGFIFRVCNVKVDDSDRKTKKRKQSDDSVVGNTSSTSAIGGEYEVFLSFTGQDTPKIFTDFLYNDLDENGIHTLSDNDKLRVGEKIGPELLKAIKESKISIPIFSKNYASSKWCLLELAQMVVCQKTMGQKILPIFYDVEPYDVRHQTGSYEAAFLQHDEDCRQHKEGFDEKTVQEWREALREVGQLKGWELEKETGGYEGKLVKMVVEEVLSQLKQNYMVVTDNLVGIDHHIGEMKRLLNVDSNDVRIVGIYGMGGLGKTTIAKDAYNKLSECFDCCCFLEDVREMSQQDSGLVNLQKQLISKIRKVKVSDIDIATIDDGINKIKGMACKKKVLIVLDDVDDKSQFDKLVGKCNWFGSGSRIIVTTRDKKVLNVLEVSETYEPQPMEPNHALQLFSRHAYRSDFPPEDNRILSIDVVSTTGGLPLALEIIGSILFGECEEVWKETLKKLRNIPDDQVQKKLIISYESLTDKEKHIFLDIACFFIGENKTRPFYMWDDCEYYPISGIRKLVLRSLVKIGDDNKFRMHDQLRDLGREIVRQENTIDPGERSRLWRHDEALEILDRQTGTKKVEALYLQTYSWEHSFTNDKFGKLPNLRFLRVGGARFTGDFNNLLSNLRWLQWCECSDDFKPINFHLKNLVILDLSKSRITENWEGWSQIEMAKKLKVLDLSGCNNLTITPDLSNLVMLKELDLSDCGKLVEVRGLTGLKSLEHLDMRLCKSLERLPDLSNLVMLKGLDLFGCFKLVEVRDLTGLKSLENLDMRWVSLERLPDLSNLVMLKRLNLSFCYKLVEVRGLTGLKSLENLDMRWCKSLERLPDLSNLVMLKGLDLSECNKLVEVRGLSSLKSLENLNVCLCISLERLPYLSNLVMLKRLDLSKCYKLVEVRGLTGLKSLENLDMRWCRSLERLPDLSNLVMLKSLLLSECNKLVEVRGLSGLKSLENLYISRYKSLERLPDLSNLVMLKRLDLVHCDKLVEVTGLTGLKSLENLNMRCKSLERLPDLSNLVMLKGLDLSGCIKLVEITGLTGLKSLEYLDMSFCTSLERLPDLSNLVMLKGLDLSECKKLVEITGLTGLKSLENLDMSWCTSLERLPDLSNLVMLKGLDLFGHNKLVEVRGLMGLKSLENLDMSRCKSLERLPDLSNLVMLKELNLSGCYSLVEVRGLTGLKSLEKLNLSECNLFEGLLDLSNLKNLKELKIHGSKNITEIRGLEELESLTLLDISGCKAIIEKLPNLSNTKILTDSDEARSWDEEDSDVDYDSDEY